VLLCGESRGAYQTNFKFRHKKLSMREIYVGGRNLKKGNCRLLARMSCAKFAQFF